MIKKKKKEKILEKFDDKIFREVKKKQRERK